MDLWDKLEERLRSVANNKANGGCNGVALICVNLLLGNNGELAGWYRPQRIPLEPKNCNVSLLCGGQKRLENWQNVIAILQDGNKDKTIVVLDGQPVGFLP